MKTLTILGLVQTVVLLLLFGKIIAIEDKMVSATPNERNVSVTDDLANTRSQSNSNATYLYPNEDQLRLIIREELGAQLDHISGPGKQLDSVIASSAVDEPETEYQRQRVIQQLEYHTSVGRISPLDMQKLQGEIAKLDEAGRKEMLINLTRAINSGKLEGQP